VLDAAAIGAPDRIYGEEVVCYVVPRPGLSLTETQMIEQVLEHCRARLAPAKVPKQVLIVSELPKSDRGKVLRDKLKDDWNQRMRLTA
jgi:acyl-coenzyme A synthetase/AMP-(fatty) acid ligase